MAALSDTLLLFTVLAYLAAMVCHAAEYAFVTRPARRPVVRRGALIGVDGSEGRAPQEAVPSAASAGEKRAALLTWAAWVAMGAAVAVHLAALVTRGLAAERLPWGNMYEYLLTTTLVGAVAWLWVLVRHPSIRHLGLYVALVNAALLGIAVMGPIYTPVGPLVPALDSYWFVIHITAASLASGIFLIGFVTAVMYLIRAGYDRGERRFPYPLGARLPGAEAVERLTFRLHAFGFPIWTFAVVAGAVWAEAAWGRYWGWDPKEVWALITWLVYAAYLHARATPSVKRTIVAWLAVIGWLTMLMNLFGVNLFFEGLHSYA